MSNATTLDGPTRAMGKLYEQLRWGESARRPGLADTLAVANARMGAMLDQLCTLHDDRVREMRDRNLADSAGPVRPDEEPTP